MWPASRSQRLAVVIVVLALGYTVWNNHLRAGPAPVAQPPAGPTENLDVDVTRTYTPGKGARVQLAGINGSISVKTGRPGEVQIERLSQDAPGKLSTDAPPLPVQTSGAYVTVGHELQQPGLFGVFPGQQLAPVPADLRVTVGDDAALELLDVNGSVTVTAVQGGVTVRGGKVSADLTNLGSAGLTVAITGGDVSVDGAGGVCSLSLGDASLTALELSCQELKVTSNKSVHVEDGNALGNVDLATTGGAISVARIRAKQFAARSDSGTIDMVDATVDGPLTLQAHAGDVTLDRLGAAALTVSAQLGAVDLSDVQGQLDITAPQGDITLRRVTSSRVKVAGGSGEVNVSGDLLKGPGHEIRTAGGAVSVYIPKEASLALNADAGSGEIIVDPALRAPSGRQQLQTQIHGGDVPLTIVSGGGQIRLLTSQPMF